MILARMETMSSLICISIPLVFEFLILFINVCIFTDYVKLIKLIYYRSHNRGRRL